MIKFLKNSSLSKLSLYLLMVVMLWTTIELKRWDNADKGNKIIDWDVTSYYSYLPATFIHHDVTLEFTRNDTIHNYEKNHQFWYETAPNGSRVIKTTMGMAILYSPFFLMAHGSAYLFHFDTNGFSTPYEFFLVVSCLVYLFFGLFYLRKILLLYFNENITALTLICVLLGTNLYYYSSTEVAMAHAYLFTLTAIFIYKFIKWYENPSFKKAILVGLILGLIILVRPVNIIILLFPLFYDVYSKNSLINKLQFFVKWWKHFMIIAVLIFFVFLPQLIYWKCLTGNWMFNSYVGERFYFNNPHIIAGLLSYRKGWLVYTPMMIFAILGIASLYKSNKSFFIPLLIFVIVNIYILFSWWAWTYGGSFGCRPMVDTYSLMAIPMAAFFKSIFNKNKLLSISTFAMISVFISLNLFQSYQKRNGIIHWDCMSKEAYWQVFLKTELTVDDCIEQGKLLFKPDYDKERRGEDE